MSSETARAGRTHRNADGFTLVEVMVAVVLSGIIGLIVVQAFISARQNYLFQSNLAALQSSSRFGLEFIARTLRMAAYRGDSPSQWVLGALSGSGAQTLFGVDNDTTSDPNVKDATDSITVRYEGSSDGFVKNCIGQTVAAGALSTNTFAISPNDELQCSVDDGATFLPIVDGVESLQILYGIDSDGDADANRYVSADNVVSFDDVVSVRVSMLLVSERDNLAPQNDTSTYSLLDETVYGPGNFANDQRLRRQVTTTIRLRNRL